MNEKKVVELVEAKAEDRKDVRDAINGIASAAHLGEVRAVAVVAIMDNGDMRFDYAGGPNSESFALVGGLAKLSQEILDGFEPE